MRTVALLQSTLYAAIASIAAYSVFLGLLIITFFQNQVIFLNSITLTWFQDVNFPEQWGLLHNQERWVRAGDLQAIVQYYRGFGTSTGSPSEEGLVIDATTLAEWAMEVAGIPPSRIVLFGQSLGTEVSISLTHRFATESTPILFSGMVLVVPMADVETLTATYRIAGLIPILDPIARYPKLLAWLNTFMSSKWPSEDKLADIVRHCEQMPGNDLKYHITIIHAEDDYDIPWSHSEVVFWHGVNASTADCIRFDELEEKKEATRTDLGAGGWVVDRETKKGSIRERILKHGLHDKIMSYPVVSLAILRAFKQERSVLPTI
ncbi:putative AB hydrolase-1 domain-containing protein [Seiridium unicorne]|uniref:AB hydrolase-1 domain-containing protein n=1 Tax=Seiridium unicorne TaxID=138068 RepID=A0ABR2V5J8_9PEZI